MPNMQYELAVQAWFQLGQRTQTGITYLPVHPIKRGGKGLRPTWTARAAQGCPSKEEKQQLVLQRGEGHLETSASWLGHVKEAGTMVLCVESGTAPIVVLVVYDDFR
jgi:hypothetical protein